MNQALTITKETDGEKVTLHLFGTVNTATAPLLNDALLALNYDGLDLTVDFAETDYLTSAGLRALLVARKKLTENTMRAIHVNDAIAEVFEMTGFDGFIPFERLGRANSHDKSGYSSLLKKRVAEDGSKTAYIYKNRRYTWDDVDKASQIIACNLADMGVKKGTHVGLCSGNSVNWVFTFFAIQKLGGIAVLMSPGLHTNELVLLSSVGSVTHLCYAEIPGSTTFATYSDACLAGGQVKYTYDIGDANDITARFGEYEAVKDRFNECFDEDDAGVIIFSSGSTGRPKAILSSTYSITTNILPLVREMKVKKEDINLAFLPMFHIFGLSTGICVGLMTGYCSVIPENKSPDLMIQLIETYGCTIFNSVPTMMLAVTQTKTFSPEKLKTLRLSLLGGSPITEEQMRMLNCILPRTHFGNIYGLSENAAVSITAYDDTPEHITRTVGKPLSGIELAIRDEKGNHLPNGKIGEICLRGESMLLCYYKLTLDKQPIDGEGWLSTGDLGLIDDDGYLRITGRIKDLIINGGENISPGEIAEVLSAFPEIADVKVVGVPDALRGETVAAAVILKSGAIWNEEAVKAEAAKHLAKYKCPRHYVVFEAFPTLGSGKIDSLTLKKQVEDAIKKS